MSSQLSAPPRRRLHTRPADMVERLLTTAGEELERVGPEELRIRVVAQQAGMSTATAYSYVSSKEHLFAQLFWRRLAADPGPDLPDGTVADRLCRTIEHLLRLIEQAPATAAAATAALLGRDPEVAQLRPRIGGIFIERFREAIGDDSDPGVLDAVSLTFFGALLQTGMGLNSYEECSRRLQSAVAIIVKEAR